MNDHLTHSEEPLHQFRGYLCVLARSLVGPRLRRYVDPEDIVQDTLLKAHKAWHSRTANTPLQTKAWLKTTLIRTLLDELKKLERRGGLEVSIHDAIKDSAKPLEDFLVGEHTTPGTHASRNEEALILEGTLCELPDRQREAVQMKYWHGLTSAQISEHLGISTAAVAGLLSHGLTNLRDRWPKPENNNGRSP